MGYYGEILFILLSLQLEIVGFHCLMLILETSIRLHASWINYYVIIGKIVFFFCANFGALLVSKLNKIILLHFTRLLILPHRGYYIRANDDDWWCYLESLIQLWLFPTIDSAKFVQLSIRRVGRWFIKPNWDKFTNDGIIKMIAHQFL